MLFGIILLLAFVLALALIVTTVIFVFLQQPKFGKMSEGERLERIKQSPNYKDGQFRNLHLTPNLTEGVSYRKVIVDFFLFGSKRAKPSDQLPVKRTNLLTLPLDKNVFVWFGHSSYFMQIDGKRILVDPVMSGSASPVPATTRSFPGTDVYTTDDIPEIDYLFISHDHWDHLDYEAVINLRPKIKRVITGLGTGAHLEHWGYDKHLITEKDWDEEVSLDNGFTVNSTPARHFSGRGFTRNQVLWMSFVLKTPSLKIFIGGDSGYGAHFKSIGEKYGPFDVTILECGQYHTNWRYIHTMPEEVILAAKDLQAQKVIPVHWAKFVLGQHDWDDSIKRVVAEAEKKNITLIHPMIGEEVILDSSAQTFSQWWKGLS